MDRFLCNSPLAQCEQMIMLFRLYQIPFHVNVKSDPEERGEMWRHVTMVALFLDDNKTKNDRDGKENGKK